MTKKISEQIFKDRFENGALPSFTLWVGEEDYTKFELLTYLRSEAPNLGYNLEVYSAGEDSPSEVLGRAATPSLLGGKTLLVLTEVERCRASEHNYLMKYVEKPPADLNLIAVFSSGGNTEGEFIKDLRSHAYIVEFPPLDEKEVAAWAKEKAKAIGLEFEDKVLARLTAAFEGQLGILASEIEKLSLLFPQGGYISADEVEKKLGASAWVTIQKLTDAIQEGKLKEALEAWEEQRLYDEKFENTLASIFYVAPNLPESEENLETLYNVDLSFKTGVAPDTLLLPLLISRIVHPALRIKEEKPLWLK